MTHPAAATECVLGTPCLYIWVEALSRAGGGHGQVHHQPEPVLSILGGGGLEAAQPGVAGVQAGVLAGVDARVEAIVPHHGVEGHQALGQGDQAAHQDNLGHHLT